MTPIQKRLVQQSFAQVRPVKRLVAEEFYDRLFELDPTLRGMFRGDALGQRAMLMAMLATAVNGLDRLHEIAPMVDALGRRHAGSGVCEAHYATGEAALLWAIEQGLGPAFTPSVREAWVACCRLFIAMMQQAGRKLAA